MNFAERYKKWNTWTFSKAVAVGGLGILTAGTWGIVFYTENQPIPEPQIITRQAVQIEVSQEQFAAIMRNRLEKTLDEETVDALLIELYRARWGYWEIAAQNPSLSDIRFVLAGFSGMLTGTAQLSGFDWDLDKTDTVALPLYHAFRDWNDMNQELQSSIEFTPARLDQ